MEKRPPKEDDQQMSARAYDFLLEIINAHPEIDPTLWYGALVSCIVNGFINADHSYEVFCEEWDNAKRHYKSWFDEEE